MRALESLLVRSIPSLRRWARGRLPGYARELIDTQDLIQDTILHTLKRLQDIGPRHQGALQAYLRQAVVNRIRDEIRRAQRRPVPEGLDESHPSPSPSPLEHAIGQENLERYEAALHRLRPVDREAIIARVELQQSYEELAVALGKPSANAARVSVIRALTRLARELEDVPVDAGSTPPEPSLRETPEAAESSAILMDSITAVADGVRVAWDKALALEHENRPLLRHLQLVETVAEAHRSSVEDPDSQHPLPSLAVGDRWGHLVIVDTIGEGSFGIVYRARDPWLDREVALKLLKGVADADTARPALHEAWTLARVRDPNVVTVHGADFQGGRVGLWMELVEGRTLEQILASEGPFQPREAIATGLEICRALAAVHDAGLVHRDVTARNVIREANGRVVLMDFGASHLQEWGGEGAARRRVGTPVYLAPELLIGAPGSVQSDLYALGVLLYHLVTGSYPVRAASMEELQKSHREGRVTLLRQVQPGVPADFAHIVDTALATDVSSRYPDARAMESALAQALRLPGEGPLLAAGPGNIIAFSERAGRALGSRRWLLDRIVTRVIRLHATLTVDELERQLLEGNWSFHLAPFMPSAEIDPNAIVFLGLYPSGAVRGITVEISDGPEGVLATLTNPLCILDPKLADEGQKEVICEIEMVGLPYSSDARGT